MKYEDCTKEELIYVLRLNQIHEEYNEKDVRQFREEYAEVKRASEILHACKTATNEYFLQCNKLLASLSEIPPSTSGKAELERTQLNGKRLHWKERAIKASEEFEKSIAMLKASRQEDET